MQDKQRLLYVVGQLGGGGLERQLWYLLSTMDRERYSPAVAVWNLDPSAPYLNKLESLGLPVHRMPLEGGYFGRARRLRDLVRQIRPEIVHSYSFYTNFAAWYASRGTQTIPIGSLRNEYQAERKAAGRIGGSLCSYYPEWLIANSDHAKRAADRTGGWGRPRNVAFVPNGIDLQGYPVLPFPDTGRFEIAGIGRLYPQKRWDHMLTALAEFSYSAGVGQTWRFRLCGEGPLEPELKRRVGELEIEEHVEFMGFVDEVSDMLASSHVLALSSEYEGTPNVVMEALACGRPIVATDAGDVSRLVQAGVQGFVVPIGDTKALASRLQTLSGDPELMEKMGSAGRKRAEEMDLSALLASTFGVYRRAGWKDGG